MLGGELIWEPHPLSPWRKYVKMEGERERENRGRRVRRVRDRESHKVLVTPRADIHQQTQGCHYISL